MDIKKIIYDYGESKDKVKRNKIEIENDIGKLLAEASYFMEYEELLTLISNIENMLNTIKR